MGSKEQQRNRFLQLAKEFDDNHVSRNYDDIKDEVIKKTTEAVSYTHLTLPTKA